MIIAILIYAGEDETLSAITTKVVSWTEYYLFGHNRILFLTVWAPLLCNHVHSFQNSPHADFRQDYV